MLAFNVFIDMIKIRRFDLYQGRNVSDRVGCRNNVTILQIICSYTGNRYLLLTFTANVVGELV